MAQFVRGDTECAGVWIVHVVQYVACGALCPEGFTPYVIDLKRGKPSTPAGLAPATLYGNYNIQHGKEDL